MGRIASLDALRGLTIAVMILVDNAGSTWPAIDHSPWNGVALADFVMPSFDFIVGVSVVISSRKFLDGRNPRCDGIKKGLWRFLKIFVVGVATQGGVAIMQYNLSRIRIMGILQRVAVCFLAAVFVELDISTAICTCRKSRQQHF